MKDWLVWLQDIHENQYSNLIWQIIQNINSHGAFLPIPVKYIISTAFRSFTVLMAVQEILVAVVFHIDCFMFA